MIKKSGIVDDDRDWGHDYYQVSLEGLRLFDFTRKVFRAGAALVAKQLVDGYREEIEYTGQAYDSELYDLVHDRWDHHHCRVCSVTIDGGYSYWENSGGMIVCDVCHDHIESEVRPRRPSG